MNFMAQPQFYKKHQNNILEKNCLKNYPDNYDYHDAAYIKFTMFRSDDDTDCYPEKGFR